MPLWRHQPHEPPFGGRARLHGAGQGSSTRQGSDVTFVGWPARPWRHNSGIEGARRLPVSPPRPFARLSPGLAAAGASTIPHHRPGAAAGERLLCRGDATPPAPSLRASPRAAPEHESPARAIRCEANGQRWPRWPGRGAPRSASPIAAASQTWGAPRVTGASLGRSRVGPTCPGAEPPGAPRPGGSPVPAVRTSDRGGEKREQPADDRTADRLGFGGGRRLPSPRRDVARRHNHRGARAQPGMNARGGAEKTLLGLGTLSEATRCCRSGLRLLRASGRPGRPLPWTAVPIERDETHRSAPPRPRVVQGGDGVRAGCRASR